MKRILIDKAISKDSKNFLLSLGFDLIETIELSFIQNSTSTHPDMQFFLFGNKKALIYSETYDYYRNNLPDFTFVAVDSFGGQYPHDCLLNIARVGESDFLTKFQFDNLNHTIELLNPVFTNQGYSKCSICILNNNAILTGDSGIYKIAKKKHLNCYFLNDNEISLKGYKNGFWGGCSGILGDNSLYFNGNIELLSCYNELVSILKKENIEPIYHKDVCLCDNGSILLLDT